MSSDADEQSINIDQEISDNEQNNEILEIGENLQEQTEEVQRDETVEGEGGDENEDGERKVVKPKRATRNPQPKLDAQTLKGPRGIAALEGYFQRVKFKGKGEEEQDLNVIMKTYEYWCHRLFPKFPFDTCIERLEKLGTKRAVQTHIKRIRFDLFVEDKPILSDSDEEPNVEGFVDIQNDEINQQQNLQFDQLLSSSPLCPIKASSELTEQQLEKIRLNKERAQAIKQERLKKIRSKAEVSLQVPSQLPGISGLPNETRLESSEAAESTQSDIFSQEDYSSALGRKSAPAVSEEIEEADALFDHESDVKGKANVKGPSIKKKSNKRTAIFDSDSENSEDDNFQSKVVALSNKAVSGDMNHLKIDPNSSHSDLAQKKNIIDDSDDDHSNKENQQHQEVFRSKRQKFLNNDYLDLENLG